MMSVSIWLVGGVFELQSEDGQSEEEEILLPFLQRKTDQLLYQVYKAVEEKNGRGTVRKKW